MGIAIDTSSLLFVDTWGWCAGINPKEDQYYHVRQIMESLISSENHLITTNFVLDETYTLIRFRVHHKASLELHQTIDELIMGNLLNIVYITSELEQLAWRIFERYSDKDFSFTDCSSFSVMRLLKITQVLTNDHHFEQMGFRILP